MRTVAARDKQFQLRRAVATGATGANRAVDCDSTPTGCVSRPRRLLARNL